jgi:hypothetical protein
MINLHNKYLKLQREKCMHSILIVRGSFTVIKEAALSSDSETGRKETTNVAILMHWLSVVDSSRNGKVNG